MRTATGCNCEDGWADDDKTICECDVCFAILYIAEADCLLSRALKKIG
jgi:hypothetical protein